MRDTRELLYPVRDTRGASRDRTAAGVSSRMASETFRDILVPRCRKRTWTDTAGW
jgi:hypothetical protein